MRLRNNIRILGLGCSNMVSLLLLTLTLLSFYPSSLNNSKNALGSELNSDNLSYTFYNRDDLYASQNCFWIAITDNSEENESEEEICSDFYVHYAAGIFTSDWMFVRSKSVIFNIELSIKNRIPDLLFILHHSWKTHI